DGILVFHTSSLYVRLHPILGDLAGDAHLRCYFRQHLNVSQGELFAGKDASNWLAMVRPEAKTLGKRIMDKLGDDKRWQQLPGRPNERVWTDDYSNILSASFWKSKGQQ